MRPTFRRYDAEQVNAGWTRTTLWEGANPWPVVWPVLGSFLALTCVAAVWRGRRMLVVSAWLLATAMLVTFWVRSRSGYDYMSRSSYAWNGGSFETRGLFLKSSGGGLSLFYRAIRQTRVAMIRTHQGRPSPFYTWERDVRPPEYPAQPPVPTRWNRIGFGLWRKPWGADEYGGTWMYEHVVVPYWALGLPLVVPPAWWAAAKLRARPRSGNGLCAACGYDLRASPERCPECGCATPRGPHANKVLERSLPFAPS